MNNFSKGKSITAERNRLEGLTENMRFIGGPTDKTYEKRFRNPDKKSKKFKNGNGKQDDISDEEEPDK